MSYSYKIVLFKLSSENLKYTCRQFFFTLAEIIWYTYVHQVHKRNENLIQNNENVKNCTISFVMLRLKVQCVILLSNALKALFHGLSQSFYSED